MAKPKAKRTPAQIAASKRNLEKARAARKKGSIQASTSKPLGKQAYLNRVINRSSRRLSTIRRLGLSGKAFDNAATALTTARRRKKARGRKP